MGLLDKLLRRDKKTSQTADEDARFKRVAAEPPVSAAQEQMNRDLMEGQLADDRAKRTASEATDTPAD